GAASSREAGCGRRPEAWHHPYAWPGGTKHRPDFLRQRNQSLLESSSPPYAYAAPALRLMMRQTFSGLIGMSRWRTPNGASASTTAATIAGVAPMLPASPTPFTPMGFTGEGVSVLSSSNQGTCAARGTA